MAYVIYDMIANANTNMIFLKFEVNVNIYKITNANLQICEK